MEETQGPNLDNIKVKIAHLMDHTGRTKEEEATATALALKLAIKYNLDIAKAANWKPGTYSKMDFHVGRSKWRRELLQTICEYCFCKSYYLSAEGTNFIVGEEHNRELVAVMVRTIIAHIEPLATREFLRNGRGKIHAKAWKDQFYGGANAAIAGRLKRLELEQTEFNAPQAVDDAETIHAYGNKEEAKEGNATVSASEVPEYRALMVIKQNALIAACNQIVGKTRKPPQPKKWKWDSEAFSYGYQAGKQTPLTDRLQIKGAK